MTLHNLKRRHLHWGETEENLRLLDSLTELDIDKIEQMAEAEERETLLIDKVLEASEKNFMQSIDGERNKTIITDLDTK